MQDREGYVQPLVIITSNSAQKEAILHSKKVIELYLIYMLLQERAKKSPNFLLRLDLMRLDFEVGLFVFL